MSQDPKRFKNENIWRRKEERTIVIRLRVGKGFCSPSVTNFRVSLQTTRRGHWGGELNLFEPVELAAPVHLLLLIEGLGKGVWAPFCATPVSFSARGDRFIYTSWLT